MTIANKACQSSRLTTLSVIGMSFMTIEELDWRELREKMGEKNLGSKTLIPQEQTHKETGEAQ